MTKADEMKQAVTPLLDNLDKIRAAKENDLIEEIDSGIKEINKNIAATTVYQEDIIGSICERLNIIATKIKSLDIKQVERRTIFWIEFGDILNKLQVIVEKHGVVWSKWAKTYIKNPSVTHRRSIMEIAAWNVSKEYAFMGIDNLNNFMIRFSARQIDPEFKDIARRLGVKDFRESRNEDDLKLFNIVVIRLDEYYRFLDKMKNIDNYKNLLISAIKVGCKFTEKEYATIELMKDNQKALNEYFRVAIANKSSGGKFSSLPKHESLIVLLSKVLEISEWYITNKKSPPGVDVTITDDVLKKMKKIKKIIKDNDHKSEPNNVS